MKKPAYEHAANNYYWAFSPSLSHWRIFLLLVRHFVVKLKMQRWMRKNYFAESLYTMHFMANYLQTIFYPLMTFFSYYTWEQSKQSLNCAKLCILYAACIWRDLLTPFNHNLFKLEWQGILSLVIYEDPLQDSNGLHSLF